MATKLNQIIALEKGVKANTAREVTDSYHELQRPNLFAGLTRTYQPKHEDGDQLPAESTQVQLRTDDVLARIAASLTRLFDVVATKDLTNTAAKADIVVDGRVLVPAVPAVTLLFLEKQLADLGTIIRKLPTLDPAENWHFDEARNYYVTDPAGTTRTKKVPRNHVKAEATDRHPAQVEIFTEDVVVGTWTTTKLSGALPAKRVTELSARVAALHDAVRVAREQANMVDVQDKHIGEQIFDYLFA
jgi:hypothetical protein